MTKDKDTGNSPPISQKQYNIPLKHATWVQQDLEILEKASVATRSISLWISLTVVVPNYTAPVEPPRRMLCVNYRSVNKLPPPVTMVHSKSQSILTLGPLIKVDEIHTRLRFSHVFFI